MDQSSSSEDDLPLISLKRRGPTFNEGDGGSSSARGKVSTSTTTQRRRAPHRRDAGRPRAPVKRQRGGSSSSSGGAASSSSDDHRASPQQSSSKRSRPSPVPRAPKKSAGARRRTKVTEDAEEFERGDARRHFKDGQNKICPPVGDGGRAFYESLLQENPHSLIAIRYCVERGCLPTAQHNALLHKFNVLKTQGAYRGSVGGVKPEWTKFAKKIKTKEEG